MSVGLPSGASSLWIMQSEFDKSFFLSQQQNWNIGRSLYPNEFNVLENSFVWRDGQDLSGRAYVSVGSERSFLGASISRSGHLVGVDFDPDIVKFNRINAMLLGLSQSRIDYVFMRFSKDYSAISRRLIGNRYGYKISESEWKWWSILHQEGRWRTLIFDSVQRAGEIAQFQKLAYWNHDASWLHLRDLSRNQKMGFFLVDLNQHNQLSQVHQLLTDLGIKVGILDSSNVLAYIGSQSLARVLHIFGRGLSASDKLGWINTHLSFESQMYPYQKSRLTEPVWRFEKLMLSRTELDSTLAVEKLVSLRTLSAGKSTPFCSRTHLLDPL